MKTDKTDLMEKVLAGLELSDDEIEQLSDEDAQCHDILTRIGSIRIDDEPPAECDSAILNHATARHAAKRRPAVVYFRMALAAAAALLFTLIVIQLLPVKTTGTDESPMVLKPDGTEMPTQPDESRVINKQVSPTVADTPATGDVPEFDWNAGGIEKDLVILQAEIYMDELDYADAALVENVE